MAWHLEDVFRLPDPKWIWVEDRLMVGASGQERHVRFLKGAGPEAAPGTKAATTFRWWMEYRAYRAELELSQQAHLCSE